MASGQITKPSIISSHHHSFATLLNLVRTFCLQAVVCYTQIAAIFTLLAECRHPHAPLCDKCVTVRHACKLCSVTVMLKRC